MEFQAESSQSTSVDGSTRRSSRLRHSKSKAAYCICCRPPSIKSALDVVEDTTILQALPNAPAAIRVAGPSGANKPTGSISSSNCEMGARGSQPVPKSTSHTNLRTAVDHTVGDLTFPRENCRAGASSMAQSKQKPLPDLRRERNNEGCTPSPKSDSLPKTTVATGSNGVKRSARRTAAPTPRKQQRSQRMVPDEGASFIQHGSQSAARSMALHAAQGPGAAIVSPIQDCPSSGLVERPRRVKRRNPRYEIDQGWLTAPCDLGQTKGDRNPVCTAPSSMHRNQQPKLSKTPSMVAKPTTTLKIKRSSTAGKSTAVKQSSVSTCSAVVYPPGSALTQDANETLNSRQSRFSQPVYTHGHTVTESSSANHLSSDAGQESSPPTDRGSVRFHLQGRGMRDHTFYPKLLAQFKRAAKASIDKPIKMDGVETNRHTFRCDFSSQMRHGMGMGALVEANDQYCELDKLVIYDGPVISRDVPDTSAVPGTCNKLSERCYPGNSGDTVFPVGATASLHDINGNNGFFSDLVSPCLSPESVGLPSDLFPGIAETNWPLIPDELSLVTEGTNSTELSCGIPRIACSQSVKTLESGASLDAKVPRCLGSHGTDCCSQPLMTSAAEKAGLVHRCVRCELLHVNDYLLSFAVDLDMKVLSLLQLSANEIDNAQALANTLPERYDELGLAQMDILKLIEKRKKMVQNRENSDWPEI